MVNRKTRAFGWVQDAASIENLYKFVSIFDRDANYQVELIEKIDRLIDEKYGKKNYLKLLSQNNIKLTHSEIVGSSGMTKSRSTDPCNSIGQAALPGQKKEYQTDWSVESFLRWAHVLQFIDYDNEDDSYFITKIGKEYIESEGSQDIFKKQLLKIPYVRRVMKLIEHNELSKFEIGSQLGFVGEKGFTSVNIDLFKLRYDISNPKERKSLKSDFEGSSDKYARMICSWLIHAGIAKKKYYSYSSSLKLYRYSLNDEGRKLLKEEVEVFVPYGMLSMELSNKKFHKSRRAIILNLLRNRTCNITELINTTEEYFENKMDISKELLLDDIRGLVNIGIEIQSDNELYTLIDNINLIEIPDNDNEVLLVDDEITKVKEYCRTRLKYLDHKYLNLINASRNSQSGKEFEFITSELLKEVYETYLLAGPSRPDIVIKREEEFASIIDTKSYKNGFNIPVSEQDKMLRYITEFKEKTNGERWTNILQNTDYNRTSFMFISSTYNGKISEKLQKIAQNTGMNGCAYTAKNLLLDIDYILETKIYKDFEDKTFSNKVI